LLRGREAGQDRRPAQAGGRPRHRRQRVAHSHAPDPCAPGGLRERLPGPRNGSGAGPQTLGGRPLSEDLRDDRLTRYLLAGLPPDEEERLEQEYLRGGEAYDRLLAAEDDLIDAYAAGRLEGDEARRFEARFLATPERRERVAFARA